MRCEGIQGWFHEAQFIITGACAIGTPPPGSASHVPVSFKPCHQRSSRPS